MRLIDEKFRPMLCKEGKPFSSDDWIFELKFDGIRTLLYWKNGKIKLINRLLHNITSKFPELSSIKLKAKECILDGEIVVFGEKGVPDFYLLQSREQTSDPLRIDLLSKTSPATYVAFDILWKDGEDLTSKPWMERRKILESTVEEGKHLMLSIYVEGNGEEFFKLAIEKGFEGVIAKKKDSPYLINTRSDLWLKIKKHSTLDAIIVGYTKGEGKRSPYFGSIILALVKDGKLTYIGRCGTGWDEKMLKELKRRMDEIKSEKCPFDEFPKELAGKEVVWIKPILVAEIKYVERTKDGKLRNPSFIKLRFDKEPIECKG